ncbi:MAG TPA: cytidylate kinase-like family protein [Prolixibacteraceae bacterium]|jgi:cytidylate kinase
MKDFLSNYLSSEEERTSGKQRRPGPVITISRECGCSANRIATKLSKILTGYNYLSETKTEVEWRWVSKEIIETAALELKTNPGRVKRVFRGEARQSIHEITTAFSNAKVYDDEDQQVIDTVKALVHNIAEEGHFIIVGRAASIIAQDIPNRLSVRLQAPLDWRINRIMQISNLSWADAQAYVFEVDRQRDLFVEHVAGRPLNNTDFDLIFNYSTLLDDHIVDVIVNVLKNKRIIVNSEEE